VCIFQWVKLVISTWMGKKLVFVIGSKTVAWREIVRGSWRKKYHNYKTEDPLFWKQRAMHNVTFQILGRIYLALKGKRPGCCGKTLNLVKHYTKI
jgi:hypothetical protein